MKKILALALVAVVGTIGYWFVFKYNRDLALYQQIPDVSLPFVSTPEPAVGAVPLAKTLPGTYHVFQTFNNCGPAALSMALSHYGIKVSQEELGTALRPYQVASGDNDDKSTTLAELAEKAKEYGLTPYHRPNGSTDLLKAFIANDIPVITRTWTKKTEDIGHYRVVKGYDESRKLLIQDDSLQARILRTSMMGDLLAAESEPAEKLLAILGGPLILALTDWWLYFAAAAFGLGVAIFLLKKPGVVNTLGLKRL